MKIRQSVHEKLSARKVLFGFGQTIPHPSISEVAGLCGYDFLVLDGEHGVFSEQDYLHAFQAMAGTDAIALVRLGRVDPQLVSRYLDMGADGIVVANVSTADQVRELARAMEYPPSGTRGVAAQRAMRYGMNLAAYMKAPRDGVCLIVIIESALGVENIEDIVAVDGVDGVFVGPFDLTTDLGCAGDFSQPVYAEALARIERSALARGKFIGTAPHRGYPLEDLVARGHSLLLLGGDMPLITMTMSAQVEKARALVDANQQIGS